ncbi:uncharacterized protein LOC129752518 [Uranotaenia lowii]|uniref:uncharacterized protein LOC129752518 n=1 Tax=Uranotaenia lowii TaxID=190385 RepID=UPI002478E573|nr:uncharacterized protein LOC129752518 [Uranotaenia lowii]
MVLPTTKNPGPEVVDQLRRMFQQRMETEPEKIPLGGFHEHDLNKIFVDDKWLTKFLENNDLDMKKSAEQLWDTCTWRKTENINEPATDSRYTSKPPPGSSAFLRDICLTTRLVVIQEIRTHSEGSFALMVCSSNLGTGKNNPYTSKENQTNFTDWTSACHHLQLGHHINGCRRIENSHLTKMARVHFANLSPPDSPMNESSNSNFENIEGEMLRITPQNTIVFTKSGTELVGNVDIENIDSKPITFKIKTTAPEKFRVRPSNGVLAPGGVASINVVLLQQGHQIAVNPAINREKFLVMCMALTEMFTNTHDIAEFWKNTPANSAAIEQHRLKCSLPMIPDDPALRNGMPPYGDMFGPVAGFGGSDKQMLHLQQVITQLSGTTHRLESQIRFNQKLQWISLALFLFIAIAIIYILKAEIKGSAAQYCLKP